jgi:hypothetical protein
MIGIAVVLTFLSTVGTATAGEPNNLEVVFTKYDSGGSVFVHAIFMSADKDFVTTGELVTPLGSYALVEEAGEWRPEEQFNSDHADLSFDELTAAISGGWTLTWDAAIPAMRTVASISFGSVPSGDFRPVPTLVAPEDGVPLETSTPTMEWAYDMDPCVAQIDFAVNVSDHPTPDTGTDYGTGELPCTATSWTPPLLSPGRFWYFRVANQLSYRDVPDGITIIEGSWTLENSDWLALQSVDGAACFLPESVPTQPVSWGAVKIRY